MALSSCGAPRFSTQTATASDEWSRTFPLDATGEVQILNISGVVTVDASPGTSVEVHAERVAHAATEQVARDFLTHVSIKDESTPNSVTVQTEPIAGVFIGVHFEVNYRVRVPASASVKVRTSNGDVTVTGVGGHVSVNDANGNVVGRLIGRGFDAHSTNGRVDVEIEKPTDDPIELRTVNGGILLTLPPSMDANLSASAVNGRANVTGLKFQLFGDPPGRNDRRLRGRINAGGPPIELNTVNGDIRVRAHE
jgi:hypothetical protein